MSTLIMSPDCLVQHLRESHLEELGSLVDILWLVQHAHAVVPEHLETSEERWMSIKTSTSAKAGNSHNWHVQSCEFAQNAECKCV